MCGVLIPSIPSLSFKAVNSDTLRLIESLIVPGPLPKDAAKTFAKNGTVLLRMVLDSILEVKTPNGFASGASLGGLLKLNKPQKVAQARSARLSIEALQYAQALECNYPPVLSARMYFYNRIPVSPRWTNRISSAADFAHFLGIEAGTEICHLLESKWIRRKPSPKNPRWFIWHSHKHMNEQVRLPYKVYLSPMCEDLKDTLRITLPIITELEIPAFKLGLGLHGILRPDKFVIYLSSYEKLKALVNTLLRVLRGIRAHSIPFTSVIDAEGLISWGMDPPRTHLLSTWQGTSWRKWVTDHLAVALLMAKNESSGTSMLPSEFALQRLRLEGVNTETWTPSNIPWMCKQPEGN
jgi:hypothetical protein